MMDETNLTWWIAVRTNARDWIFSVEGGFVHPAGQGLDTSALAKVFSSFGNSPSAASRSRLQQQYPSATQQAIAQPLLSDPKANAAGVENEPTKSNSNANAARSFLIRITKIVFIA